MPLLNAKNSQSDVITLHYQYDLLLSAWLQPDHQIQKRIVSGFFYFYRIMKSVERFVTYMG
ncbi:hypothetical protein DSM02_1580 [Leeuwenhoekiella polynyae]|uniref:Uncharacterized protein n=1 Tax=Leeuwenhoekiella polynyae TaxID=1550906 RepID=A0A4Q0P813_9FLAO|nr:hypothetical protein DSM02_1580 [Leeuwenhoekiella polynyae]